MDQLLEVSKMEKEKSQALKAENEKRFEEVDEKCEMRIVFSTFDKNGDGFIGKKEIAEVLRTLQIRFDEEGLRKAIANADANGDGIIDFGKFSVLYESLNGDDAYLREAFNVYA